MKKKKLEEQGIDPKEQEENIRALKALAIIKKDYEEKNLSEIERNTLCAVIIDRCYKSFFFFCRYILEFDLLTEQTHKRWADDLQKAIKKGKTRFMRLKPRGCFKSTIYGIGFVLWLWACVSPKLRLFYTSSNSLLLNEISDKINQYIGNEKSDTLFSYIFGVTKDPNAKNTGDVFNIDGRSGKGFSLILRTAGGNTVGIHPNIIIVDDPVAKEDRESETVRIKKEQWFDSLIPLLVPFFDEIHGFVFESIFYIGTVWHMQDLTHYIRKMNKKLPENKKWDIEIESIEKEDGTTNYPDFISNERIQEIKSSISDVFYACQYLNKSLPEGMMIFDLERLNFIRPEQFESFRMEGELLCVFDPSLGKKAGDYPAVWWILFRDNKLYFFDAIDKKIEIALIVHQIAHKNMQYGCRNMLFESNGLVLVRNNIEKAHNNINWSMTYQEVQHYSNKDERIISCQPDCYSGSVIFMSDYKERYPEAMAQITFYPVYGHDDFPDAMQMGIEYFKKPRFEFNRYEELL